MDKFFINYIKQKKSDKIISIYIDMDGVVVDYDMENHKGDEENTYLNKRPVTTVINILKEASNLSNIDMHILSVARHKNQVPGKLTWLEKYMPFIKKENIHIISREEKGFIHPSKIKLEYLKNNLNHGNINIHIDDDHLVLKEIHNNIENITVLHPSSIID